MKFAFYIWILSFSFSVNSFALELPLNLCEIPIASYSSSTQKNATNDYHLFLIAYGIVYVLLVCFFLWKNYNREENKFGHVIKSFIAPVILSLCILVCPFFIYACLKMVLNFAFSYGIILVVCCIISIPIAIFGFIINFSSKNKKTEEIPKK